MSEEDLQRLKAEIEAHTDKTLGELKEELKLPCSESGLSRIVREKLGFRRKKKVIHASEQERPRCGGKAEKMGKNIPELPKTKPLFLDESGVNTNMARRYDRAIGKQRAADAVPLNTPKRRQSCPPCAWTGSLPAALLRAGRQKTAFWNIYVRICCSA